METTQLGRVFIVNRISASACENNSSIHLYV